MKEKAISVALMVMLLATVAACAAPEVEPAPAPEPAPEAAPAPEPAPALPPAIELENEITIEFYSSFNPMTPGEAVVDFMTELFNQSHSKIKSTWKWLPLPGSVDTMDKLPPDQRKYSLPFVLPVTDFLLARAGGGPEQHRYERAYTDLMFMGNVTNGGWTFLTRDPELAADPKKLAGKVVGVGNAPEARSWGSPDLLAYAMLRDAWGIFDEADKIKAGLLQVGGMFDAEMVDAVFWGMANNMSGTFHIPPPLSQTFKNEQYYWIPLTQEDVNKINAANTWKISLLTVPKGSIALRGAPPTVNPPEDVTMCNFGGAMAAWADTEDDVVYEMLRFIVENADKIKEANLRMQPDPKKMAQWPGLTADMVHPGALRFYSDLGIKIGE